MFFFFFSLLLLLSLFSSPLDLPAFHLFLRFLVGLAYPRYEDRVLRRCTSSAPATVYQRKSCQESLLQKRKVNVVVLVPVFIVLPHRPRFLLRRSDEPIVPSTFRFRFSLFPRTSRTIRISRPTYRAEIELGLGRSFLVFRRTLARITVLVAGCRVILSDSKNTVREPLPFFTCYPALVIPAVAVRATQSCVI